MFGPVLYGRFTPAHTGKAIPMTNEPIPETGIYEPDPFVAVESQPDVPDATEQVEPGEPAASDPTLPTAPTADSGSALTADGADTGSAMPPEDTAPVHTFQVTHKIANPENPNSHSLIHSAELSVDEAIAWIRDRLLKS